MYSILLLTSPVESTASYPALPKRKYLNRQNKKYCQCVHMSMQAGRYAYMYADEHIEARVQPWMSFLSMYLMLIWAN